MAKVEAICPWCAGDVGPFENLRDGDPPFEECAVKCWTIIHNCPVLKSTIVCEGNSVEACAERFNTRPREAALEAALAAIRRYPNIEKYIGTDLCEMADAALAAHGDGG